MDYKPSACKHCLDQAYMKYRLGFPAMCPIQPAECCIGLSIIRIANHEYHNFRGCFNMVQTCHAFVSLKSSHKGFWRCTGFADGFSLGYPKQNSGIKRKNVRQTIPRLPSFLVSRFPGRALVTYRLPRWVLRFISRHIETDQ
jgi:hypothetical protein